MSAPPSTTRWTFPVTTLAAFMVSLDNLVVTTALPEIRTSLGADLADLEWTVNAYTLTFGVLLLTGATLGERFGRRRILGLGIALFTVASALAALAPNVGTLIAARAVQGVGGAMILPLTLTMLSAAVAPERRGAALGVWGAVSGLGVAFGPLIGGAVVDGWAWQWIFWINVPVGILLAPIALTRLSPARGTAQRLDLPGLGLITAGLLGIVWGLVRGNAAGWGSAEVVGSLVVGGALTALFVAWEARTAHPMLPLRLFRNRGFAASNATAMLFSFGMFGSIFLLAQFLQTVQGAGPFEAGLKMLPWTAMPMLVAPLAGPLSDRIGGRPLLVVGLLLQAAGLAWLAGTMAPDTPYSTQWPAFVISGIGMALFFVPIANVVLGSVSVADTGVASGANNAIREIGGVFGVAVLAAVFSHQGGYASAQSYSDGTSVATWVGVGVVLAGAAAAVFVPGLRRSTPEPVVPPLAREPEPVPA
ncbi:DHA2 family efflux MFS transporter permease subunit [Cryptosporangium aurantiacum]|uniref:Drug resistance transporter, EmrB/QacA subfamily n=1 Tax=Cryptosporangium aurantiacum TaxID=134849 RepID=A0A1M7QX19_9ACTN|nr:DHA2 family efflux MFS transporter permease subunit [Cryptosporangium aurantiacum]SHN36600.1 drug resistance transporter, EmrB/QacA subfamily [Cryptosporangium aurantiacum]